MSRCPGGEGRGNAAVASRRVRCTHDRCPRQVHTRQVSPTGAHTIGVPDRRTHDRCPRQVHTRQVSPTGAHTTGVPDRCTHDRCPPTAAVKQ
ncbi:hypothetical protein ACOMHN_041420 [Nucella lapillus]